MSLAEKKQNLLHIVQDADEKLTGLLIALANEYNATDFQFTDEEIGHFEKIRDNMINEPGSNYSEDQIFESINKRRNNAS
ncbi:hypothetical protein BH09BAC2_BH09BAC2_14120 [soil metagenome]